MDRKNVELTLTTTTTKLQIQHYPQHLQKNIENSPVWCGRWREWPGRRWSGRTWGRTASQKVFYT